MATTTDNSSIELNPRPYASSSCGDESLHLRSPASIEENQGFSLPPVDGGKDAWLCLFGCFTLEALIWGFPASYGIFQEYYSSHEPFAGASNIAVVGTCAMGIMYMDLPLIFTLLKFYPKLRRWSCPAGLLLACLSLGLSSLSNNVIHLIITQGIFYSIGGGFAWTPVLFYLEEWWVQRRGFAYGITIAGVGLSGSVTPLILEWLLNSYGFRTTLRIFAIAFFILMAPLGLIMKPRLPLSQTSLSRRFDISFWTNSTYLIFQAGNIIQGLGYFLPALYLPTYARTLGASTIESVLTIVVQNAATFLGSMVMGLAADRYHVTTCVLVSALGSALSVFLLWGMSINLPLLYVFSFLYGASAGSYSSTWSAITRATKEKSHEADSGMVFACLSAGKGVGNLVSGPLSEALLKAGSWHHAGLAYGSGYGSLIVFTGVTALLGGWGFAAKRVGWIL